MTDEPRTQGREAAPVVVDVPTRLAHPGETTDADGNPNPNGGYVNMGTALAPRIVPRYAPPGAAVVERDAAAPTNVPDARYTDSAPPVEHPEPAPVAGMPDARVTTEKRPFDKGGKDESNAHRP